MIDTRENANPEDYLPRDLRKALKFLGRRIEEVSKGEVEPSVIPEMHNHQGEDLRLALWGVVRHRQLQLDALELGIPGVAEADTAFLQEAVQEAVPAALAEKGIKEGADITIRSREEKYRVEHVLTDEGVVLLRPESSNHAIPSYAVHLAINAEVLSA